MGPEGRSTEFTYLKILLVEDNPGDALLVEERLSEARVARFSVIRADRLGSAIRSLGDHQVDAILLDLGLPDSHGLDTLDAIREEAPGIPVVVLTGYEDERTAIEAVRSGAQDYLVKGPIDAKLLSRSILYAYERQAVVDELRASEERFRTLIEEMEDAVMILDDEGTVQFVNPAAQSMFGPHAEEVVGMHLELPDVGDGSARVDIVDPHGERAVAQARVTDITWDGKESYLITVPGPARHGEEPVPADRGTWTPRPLRNLR